jgi:uncharacterized protein (TIGR00369 family)
MADKTDLRALVEGVTAKSGFTSLMGARVIAVEKGNVQLAVDRRRDLLQFNGHFHGGVIATLADHAAGGAVTTALPAGKIAITVDMHLNYLAPAAGEALLAKATAIQVGSTIGVAQVDVITVINGAERACAVALGRIVGVADTGRPRGHARNRNCIRVLRALRRGRTAIGSGHGLC